MYFSSRNGGPEARFTQLHRRCKFNLCATNKYSSKKRKSKGMDIGVMDGDFVYGINEYYSTIKLVTELSLCKKFLTVAFQGIFDVTPLLSFKISFFIHTSMITNPV